MCKLSGDYMWFNITALLEKIFNNIFLSYENLYFKIKLLMVSLVITLMMLFTYSWDIDKAFRSLEIFSFLFITLSVDIILCFIILLDSIYLIGKKIKKIIYSIIYSRKKKKIIMDKLSNEEIAFLVYNFYEFYNFEFKSMEYIERGTPIIKSLYDKKIIKIYGRDTDRLGNYNYKLVDDIHYFLNQALKNGNIVIDIGDGAWGNDSIIWFNRRLYIERRQ